MKHTSEGGNYKDKPNNIVIWHPVEKEGTVFEIHDINDRAELPRSPIELALPQLNALLTWAGVCFRLEAVHPLYLISIFAFEFLKIYPFNDGNGRTVRTLIILMLIQRGYDFPEYASLERYFEAHRKLKFDCLSTPRIRNWIVFILSCLDAIGLELELQAGVESKVAIN